MLKRFKVAMLQRLLKSKQHRVNNLIESYAQLLSVHSSLAVPLVITGYKDAAHALVEKTFEDPMPLADLLDALDKVIAHYGPTIAPVIGRVSADLDRIQETRLLKQHNEAFTTALAAIDQP